MVVPVAAEVASPRLDGRHGEEPRHIDFAIGPLVAGEEEQLVPEYRPTKRAAPLILHELGLVGVGIEHVPRLERAVDVVLEESAVEVVRARFREHVDGCASSHAGLGVHAVGHDVDGLDRFQRRTVGHETRKPDERVAGAVNPGVVSLVGLSADRRHLRLLGIGGKRMGGSRRRHAGHERQQGRVVPDAGHRQVVDLLRVDLAANLRPIGLKRNRRGCYGHRLREGRQRQLRVGAGHRVRRDLHARGGDRRERVRANRHIVGPRLQVRKKEASTLVRFGLARQAGAGMLGAYRGSDHRQTAWVGDVADQRSIEGLRREVRGQEGEHE